MRTKLKGGALWLVGAGVAAVMLSANLSQAQARPTFPGIFARKYLNLLEQVKEAKCTVCHPAEDNEKKEKRNNYGTALEKALGEKMVKDKEKVNKALEKIEKEPSAIKGKTFGDLIKEGKLPASTEATE